MERKNESNAVKGIIRRTKNLKKSELEKTKLLKEVAKFFNESDLEKFFIEIEKKILAETCTSIPQEINRKGLSFLSEEKLRVLLKLPRHLEIGTAIDNGDCFFDALAQALNTIRMPQKLYTNKSLREACYQYYLDHKDEVNQRHNKDYNGIDQKDNYSYIRYTKEELDSLFDQRAPIWGRYHVEGILLCNQLALNSIHVIELFNNVEMEEIIPSHYWVTKNEVKRLSEDNELSYSIDVPVLILGQEERHFVPVLNKNTDLLIRVSSDNHLKNQPKKQFCAGRSNYGEVVRRNFRLVDKTLFIKAIFENTKYVKVITRPKRFGKSLNLSMLQHFMAEEVDGEPTKDLFKYSKISYEEEIVRRHQGNYTIIFLDFKNLDARNYDIFIENFRQEISVLYEKFAYILEKNCLTPEEKKRFKRIQKGQSSETQLKFSLRNLANCITKYNKKYRPGYCDKPFILIDEYDTPLISANCAEKNYFDVALSFVKGFLKAALKSSEDNVEGAVITGIFRISGTQLFSDLNNPGYYSLSKTEFSEYFGFTAFELEEILKDFSREDQIREFEKWYGYFYCGKTMLFNPWSIVNLLSECEPEFKGYWSSGASDKQIEDIITNSSNKLKRNLAKLVDNGIVESIRNEEISFIKPPHVEEDVWVYNVLLISGYLTAIPFLAKKAENIDNIKLIISNLELFNIFHKILSESSDLKKEITFLDRTSLLSNTKDIFDQEKLNFLYSRFKDRRFKETYEFIRFCSFLYHNNIPFELYDAYTQVNNQVLISKIIVELEENFLIQRNMRYSFNFLSPALLNMVLDNFAREQNELYLAQLNRIGELLNERFNYDCTNANTFTQSKNLYKHVRKIIELCINQPSTYADSSWFFQLAYKLIMFFLYIKLNFQKSQKYCIAILENSPDYFLIGSFYSVLGKIFYRLNVFDMSEYYYNEAKRRLIGNDNKDINLYQAVNLIRLGKLHKIRGKYAESLAVFNDANAVLKGNDIIKFEIRYQITALQMLLERINIDDAVKIQTSLYEELESYLGEEKIHPCLVKCLLFSGTLFLNLEQNIETVKNYFDLAEKYTRNIYGEDHPEYAKVLSHQLRISQFYDDIDFRFKKAEAIFLKYYNKEGSEKPRLDFVNLYMWMGDIQAKHGYPYQANIRYELAYVLINELSEVIPSLTGYIYNASGEVKRIIGEIDDAEAKYKKLKDIFSAISETDTNIGVASYNLGEIELMRANYLTALELFEDASQKFKPTFPENHIRNYMVRHNILKSRYESGDYTHLYDNPKSYYKKTMEMVERGFELDILSDILHSFGEMYSAAGNISEALFFVKEACKLRIKHEQGANQPYIGKYYVSGAIIYSILGKPNKAMKYLKDANQVFIEHAWVAFPDYARLLFACAYYKYLFPEAPPLGKLSLPSLSDESASDSSLALIYIEEAMRKYYKYGFANYISAWAELYLLRSKIAYINGDLENALVDLEHYKRLCEEYFPKKHQKYAEAFFYKSRVLLRLGKKKKSEVLYNKFLEKNDFPYTFVLVMMLGKLSNENLLGFVKLSAIEEKVNDKLENPQENSIKISNLELNETFDFLLRTTILRYNELEQKPEKETCLYQIIICSEIISICYAYDRYDEAKFYIEKYKEHLGHLQLTSTDYYIFIDILWVSFLIPTKISRVIDFYKENIHCLESVDYLLLQKQILYNNLGCLHQVQACRDRLWGNDQWEAHLKEAESNYKKSLELKNPSATSAEYAKFLYFHKCIDDLIQFLFFDVNLSELSENEELIYGEFEKPILPESMKKAIEYHKVIRIPAILLIYYFRSYCYKEKSSCEINKITLEMNLKDYEFFVFSHEIPLYYYFLGESYLELKQFDKAEIMFNKAVEFHCKNNNEKDYSIASELRNLCKVNIIENKQSSMPEHKKSPYSSGNQWPHHKGSFSEGNHNIPSNKENSSDKPLSSPSNEKIQNSIRLLKSSALRFEITLRNKINKSILSKFRWQVFICGTKTEKRIGISLQDQPDLKTHDVNSSIIFEVLFELRHYIKETLSEYKLNEIELNITVVKNLISITSTCPKAIDHLHNILQDALKSTTTPNSPTILKHRIRSISAVGKKEDKGHNNEGETFHPRNRSSDDMSYFGKSPRVEQSVRRVIAFWKELEDRSRKIDESGEKEQDSLRKRSM